MKNLKYSALATLLCGLSNLTLADEPAASVVV